MADQPDLFSAAPSRVPKPPTGAELAAEGMKLAADHADAETPNWSDRAYEMFERFVRDTADPFHTDDVRQFAREQGLPDPPDARAWGSIPIRAVKARLIRKLGHSASKNPVSHCCPKTAWQRR